jgi:hypothetical protein
MFFLNYLASTITSPWSVQQGNRGKENLGMPPPRRASRQAA